MTSARLIDALRLAAKVSFVAGLAAVVWLSLTPIPVAPSGGLFSDKLQHLAAYAALAAAGGVSFAGSERLRQVAVGLFALGLAMEAAQAFIPGRLAGLDDMVANTLGIIIGSSLAWAANRVLRATAAP